MAVRVCSGVVTGTCPSRSRVAGAWHSMNAAVSVVSAVSVGLADVAGTLMGASPGGEKVKTELTFWVVKLSF